MPDSQVSSSNLLFDSQAATYGADGAQSVAAMLKYALLRRYVTSSCDVLDVGCANGIHLTYAAPLCRDIHGVDTSEPMLEEASTRLTERGISNAELRQADATSLPYPEASFDLSYCFSTLFILGDADRAVAEISRVLRPGGIALLDFTGRW